MKSIADYKVDDELIVKMLMGNEEQKKFFTKKGLVVGEKIKVLSEVAGNYIVQVKDSRVALDKEMAKILKVIEDDTTQGK